MQANETLKALYKTLKTTQKRLSEVEHAEREPLAVVGMACRFPGGAATIDSYRSLLESGGDGVCDVPPERWDAARYYDPDPEAPGKATTQRAGFLREPVDGFDCAFFHLSPQEVERMDPQQRLLLEVCWEAFENAGIDLATLKGSRTGVFCGIANSDYAKAHLRSGDPEKIDAFAVTGTALSSAVGRVSYLFGFEGPNLALDTACSSSLVAVHLAGRSLRSGESDLAVAAGINLILTPEGHIGFSKIKAISPDGRCKSFDDGADGYGRGEGCGVVLLKRLADARKAGDRVLALIRSTAVNQDGRTNGFTAPSSRSQEKLLRQALEAAALSPQDIGYIEAHGTGTPLGDPIEMEAIGKVYSAGREGRASLYVGSVKANIGHLEAAAGIAGVIKTVLMLEQGAIFPQIHFNQPSRHIPWQQLPVKISSAFMPWPAGETPRSAGVSSFGFSGTNAHVILQEYLPESEPMEATHGERGHHILTLSARTSEGLKELAGRYDAFLSRTDAGLGDICHTAAVGRTHFSRRLAVAGRSKDELREKLAAGLGGPGDDASPQDPRIVFLFTGQGSQYHRMGWDLYQTQPLFKAVLEQCDDLLRPHMDRRLIELLYADDAASLHQTQYTQPVIFTVAYALARLLESWGIKPALMVGHSIGEYVAATLAGIFDLEAALGLVAARGRLVQSLPANGGMAVLTTGEQQVRAVLDTFEGPVSIAALNAPKNTVISGEKAAVQALCDRFRKERVSAHILNVSHAFHSCMLDPVVESFRELAAGIAYATPQLPIMANVSGRPGGAEMAAADYWTAHLREPVRFCDSMRAVGREGYAIFLEVGGTSTLVNLGRQCLAGHGGLWLTTLGSMDSCANLKPGRGEGHSDWEPLLSGLAGLYTAGCRIDWQAFDQPYSHRRVALPNYPFQRKRYWMDLTGRREENSGLAETAAAVSASAKTSTSAIARPDQREQIAAKVLELMYQSSEMAIASEDYDTNLFELGFASMMIARLKELIKRVFGADVKMTWFYDRLDTFNKIVDFISQVAAEQDELNPAQASLEGNRPVSVLPGGADSLVSRQMELMERQLTVMSEQLKMLGGNASGKHQALLTQQTALLQDRSSNMDGRTKEIQPSAKRPPVKKTEAYVAYRGVTKREKLELNRRQQAHLKTLIDRYTGLTPASKAKTQKYREVFANTRNISGFRPEWKEMIYQIIVDKAQGARFTDVDGREFLDISMGFGVYLFGHNPPFVQKALQQALVQGTPIGPMSNLSGAAATLIHELTGVERTAFFNTGTEAVMAAMRIARTVTGRKKIVIFSGSYHGHFDGVMAVKDFEGDPGRAVPMCPGTLPEMVRDIYVLDYDTEEALAFIEAHGRELAAVLVEPVQSRKPELQPAAFLKQLREITSATGAALIFDEMIVGFRTHPGGAQAWFDVQADIVTYGKVVGGGVPIGVVAGKSYFLDAVDGGMWRYGDGSCPERENTFIAGTFNHHPLAMAGAHAVLTHMKESGPALQERLNRRTADLAQRLNTYFDGEGLPLHMTHFGSLFRLPLKGDQELLYYHLLCRGIYIWEGRNCFLSTAHSDADVNYLVDSVQAGIEEMRAGGLFRGKTVQQVPGGVGPEAFPLSTAQNRMFVLSQAGGETGYHIPVALWIDGPLDKKRVEEIFTALIREHEILRTGFSEENGRVVQTVQSQAAFVVEAQEIAEEDVDQTIRAFIRPFDLAKPPLLRVGLVQITPERHLLILDAHHIVFDGISANLLMEDFIRRYCGETPSESVGQYRDYVADEQAYMAGEDYARQEAYWLEQFSAPVPPLDLPADFRRPPVKSFQGDKLWRVMQGDALKSLRGLARRTGSSLHMTLLAAYGALLYKLTGNEDVVVGTTYDGRGEARFAHCLGMFVQTLPVRCRPEAGKRFCTLLDEVKKAVLEAHDHQRYPFEHLAEKLNLVRDPGRNPLFDTMFVYETQAAASMQAGGLTFTEKNFSAGTSIFDLVLDIADSGEALKLQLEYSTDLFSPGTAERFLDYYETLLKQLSVEADTPLADLQIISAEEERRLLETFNATAADYPQEKTLTDLFEMQAAATPQAVAVTSGGRSLTYGELNTRANRLAHHLRDAYGVGPDDRVALLAERGEGVIIGILGILKAGGAYVPLDPDYPKERIDFMLQDSGAKAVVTEAGLGQLLGNRADWVDLAAVSRAPEGCDQNPQPHHGPRHLAYVIYTSGSTGTPKGVLIEHRQVVRLMVNDKFQFDFSDADVWTLFHSCCFDFSVWEIFGALLYGGKLVIVPKEIARDTERFLALLKEHGVTVLNQTPRAFYNLAALETAASGKNLQLRYVIFGGEALKPALLGEFQRKYPEVKLINMYGITETTVHVTRKEIGPAEIHADQSNVGRPIPTLSVYIMDRDLKLLPLGRPGELVVGGDGVARGYLNREDLTREKFVDNPYQPGERLYRSGDLARLLPDGEIEYLGRIDQQVKIRGFRIEPGEIESALLQHPGIDQAVVLAMEDDGGDRSLRAFITGAQALSIDALRGHLADRLPEHMIPARFVHIEAMPLTVNGKIDTKALRAVQGPGPASVTRPAEPQTENEALLVRIWQEVLGREEIGILDNYFALGGDSIKAIQILSRLKQHRFKLQVRHIFETPFIQALAQKLEADRRTSFQGPVTGKVPLTAIQRRFFSQNPAEYDHFAQAVLLRAAAPVDEAALQQALTALQTHHDALRMRGGIDGGQVVQEMAGPDYSLDLEVVDLREEINAPAVLAHICAQTPPLLKIETGPLLKTVLFKMEDEDRLLLVIHHLAVDGVSWRILLEDLARCYDRALRGRPLDLPPKSDSLQMWAREVVRYSESPRLLEELPFWRQLAEEDRLAVPADFESATDCYAHGETLRAELTPDRTRALIGAANRAYHTEATDLLLTALGRAMARCFGVGRGVIEVEGHGREPLDTDLDLSRTVGWFTSIYPVLIDLPEGDDPGLAIRQVKEGLRRIPEKGVGYGILKYLAPEEHRESLASDNGRILFNYLGAFDGGSPEGFRLDEQGVDNTVGGGVRRECEVMIEGAVIDQSLKLSLNFNTRIHCRETAERLLAALREELLVIIDHCVARKVSAPTPHDLSYPSLSLPDLDRILRAGGLTGEEVQDIYPLSPLQEGMLFHAMLESESDAYFMQISFGIAGRLDSGIFEECWHWLVRRHAILRTRFIRKGADRPLQVVLRDGRMDFHCEDIRRLSPEEQREYLAAFRSRDREEGVDPLAKSPMRVRLFQTADQAFAVVWSFHHLLMDGWCAGILMSEFFEAYGSLLKGRTPAATPAPPYSDYIRWIEALQRSAAVDYWKKLLNGYEQPATLPRQSGRAGEFSPQTLVLSIEPQAMAGLRQFAADRQVTINTIVQAAWGLVLSRYSGADDVVFGATVSGRPAQVAGIESMVGLFINTVPVRIRIDPAATLATLVRKVQVDALQGEAHHYGSLADIQAATPVKQDLLDHVLVFENYPLADELIGLEQKYDLEFRIQGVKVFEQTHFDLSIVAEPGPEGLRVEFRYNAAVLAPELMERIKTAFNAVLKAAAAGADPLLEELRLAMMTNAEKEEREAFLQSAQQISEDF